MQLTALNHLLAISTILYFLFSSFFPLGSRQGPITIQIQDCSNDPNNNQQWENGGKIQNPGLMTRKGVQLPNIEISNYCDDFEMPPLETMSPFDFMVVYMSSSLLHLKVSKSRKHFLEFSILPKNEWNTRKKLSWELDNSKNCIRDLLTYSWSPPKLKSELRLLKKPKISQNYTLPNNFGSNYMGS